MSKERCEQAEEHSLRVMCVVDLATLISTDAFENGWPDELEDFLGLAGKRHDSVVHLSELLEITEPLDAPWNLAKREWHGILMQLATPVREYKVPVTDYPMWFYSWGYMHTGWVYGETYDAAWEQAMDWAKQRDAEDMASALKGQAV